MEEVDRVKRTAMNCYDMIVGTGQGVCREGGRIGSQPRGSVVVGFRAEYKCRYVATMQAY